MTNIELLEYSKNKIAEAKKEYGDKFRIIMKTNDSDCLEFLYQDRLGVVHEVCITQKEVYYSSCKFPEGAKSLVDMALIDIGKRELLQEIIKSIVSSLVGRF